VLGVMDTLRAGLASSVAILRRARDSLYAGARPQLHPALYVLLYAVMFCAMVTPVFAIMNIATVWQLSLNYELLGLLVGCSAAAELVRGIVRSACRTAVVATCYRSVAAGGATAGLLFWGILALRDGPSVWYEPLAFVAFCSTGWLLLAFLSDYGARQQKSREQHDA
jgi:hypothetical protein